MDREVPILPEKENPVQEDLEFDLNMVAGRQEDNHWQMPTALARYYNTNARSFVSNRRLREQITDLYPAPANIDEVPSLDNYIRTLVTGSNNNAVISRDDDLKTLQQAAHSISGPLFDA